jgi:hypothetical protein
MSRYLKADPGIIYKNKRVFSATGGATFTFPGTATTAKVFAFGGGGNSCAEYVVAPHCCLGNNACCCVACIFHHSGAGGGFSEKTYSGVGGLVGCAVVGAAEGTSSFCLPSLGTVSATGGTSTCLGTNFCGCTCTPRCTTGGAGSGGDINKCGSLGACRLSRYCCNTPGCMSCHLGYVIMPGGAPGFTTGNGIAPTVSTGCTVHTCVCCTFCNFTPYGGSQTSYRNCKNAIFTDLPRGYGACPDETNKFYAYDWDISGGPKCETSGSTLSTSVVLTQSINTFVCGGTYQCCCNYLATAAIPSTYLNGPGGITGSGGAGGTGGVGGGGGGVLINELCINCICPANCIAGGTGLVVVYY